MDPSQEIDSCPSKGKGKKKVAVKVDKQVEKTGNFKWTPHLLDILLDTLLEFGAKGGKKSDNGLGWGTLNKCVQRFKELGLGHDGRCPDSTVIKNKMRSLRDKYYLRRAATNANGFGMDSEGRILADDNTWLDYVAAHPKAKDLRNTPFRYYDRMALIYGNHMANGDNAYSMGDKDNNKTGLQSYLHELDADEDTYDCDLGSQSISVQTQSSNGSGTNGPGSSARKRKCPLSTLLEEKVQNPSEVTSPNHRRRRRSLPNFEVLENSIAKMADAAEKMSRAAWSMADAHNRLAANNYIPTLEEVKAKLRELPDLLRRQLARAIVKFGRDIEARSIFLALPEEDRKEFVMELLDGN